MKNRLDIFNGSESRAHYNVLRESINHLGRFKPDLLVRDCRRGKDFVDRLIERSFERHGYLDPVTSMNDANQQKLFKRSSSQKVLLVDKPLYHNGMLYLGMKGGVGFDENGDYRVSMIVSTVSNKVLDRFYALCCHELGHIYGATTYSNQVPRYEKTRLEDDRQSVHCNVVNCVMNQPAYNEETRYKRLNGKDMYCRRCRENIRNFPRTKKNS